MELVGYKTSLKGNAVVGFSSRQSASKMEVLSQKKILLKDISPQRTVEGCSLRLVNIGKILQSLEECACLTGILSRGFLRKLYLRMDEFVIVDIEAAVHHFGRGAQC